MNEFLRKHAIFKWSVVSVAGFIAILAIALSLFDWNALRAPLARLISAKTGFPTAAPPLEGTLAGRIKLHGTGGSIHKFASSADGSLSIVVPHGQIRAALAEFMGINVA